MTSHCGEFAIIKIWVVDCLPDFRKLEDVAVSQPVGNEEVDGNGVDEMVSRGPGQSMDDRCARWRNSAVPPGKKASGNDWRIRGTPGQEADYFSGDSVGSDTAA
jgi:hypothetical protein